MLPPLLFFSASLSVTLFSLNHDSLSRRHHLSPLKIIIQDSTASLAYLVSSVLSDSSCSFGFQVVELSTKWMNFLFKSSFILIGLDNILTLRTNFVTTRRQKLVARIFVREKYEHRVPAHPCFYDN